MNFLFGGFDEKKLKANMKMAIHRIRMESHKQTNITKANKKEIAKLIGSDKAELARIKCEHIIRTDDMIEAYGILELFLELLHERAPAIKNAECTAEEKKTTGYPAPQHDLAESIASVVFCAKKLQIDELTEVSNQLRYKYGKAYVSAAEANEKRMGSHHGMVHQRLYQKVTLLPIKAKLLDAYMTEIAVAYGVAYSPPEEMADLDEDADALAPTGSSVPVAPASNLAQAYRPTVVSQTGFVAPGASGCGSGSGSGSNATSPRLKEDLYDGTRNADGQMHGRGTMEYPDGTYIGQFVHDLRHGNGAMHYKPSGARSHMFTYTGAWWEGCRQGFGTLTEISTGNELFAGEWAQGQIKDPTQQKRMQAVLASLAVAEPTPAPELPKVGPNTAYDDAEWQQCLEGGDDDAPPPAHDQHLDMPPMAVAVPVVEDVPVTLVTPPGGSQWIHRRNEQDRSYWQNSVTHERTFVRPAGVGGGEKGTAPPAVVAPAPAPAPASTQLDALQARLAALRK